MRYRGRIRVTGAKKHSAHTGEWREKASKVWRDPRCPRFRECVGGRLQRENGMPFARVLKLKPNSGDFSWIVFKSRAHRDRFTPR